MTEQVTGLDLVELGLRVADGRPSVAGAGRAPARRGRPGPGQRRDLAPDGTVVPGAGTLGRFQPPAGRGVRVDTAGYPGYSVSTRYDSLLAKVITDGGTLEEATRRAMRALAEFDIAGVPTNVAQLKALLQTLLQTPGLGTLEVGWVDAHAAELVAASPTPLVPAAADPQDGRPSPRGGGAARPRRSAGAAGGHRRFGDGGARERGRSRRRGARHRGDEDGARGAGPGRRPGARGAGGGGGHGAGRSGAGRAGRVRGDAAEPAPAGDIPLDHVRPDLAKVRERHRTGLDEGRPEVTERRHAAGRRTARENIANLVEEGSFTEYGALTIAAQRRRRSLDDLIARTPADGVVIGTATVGGGPIAVMSYDYSVLAGTQGFMNHRKTDRLLELADRGRLPVIIFAEGGGGRPGDIDTTAVASLDCRPSAWSPGFLAGCRWWPSCRATASPATPPWPASAT